MMRREVTDAFRIRQWVLWAIAAVTFVVGIVGSWAIVKLKHAVLG